MVLEKTVNTIAQLVTLNTFIPDAFVNSTQEVYILFDLEKAYDTI